MPMPQCCIELAPALSLLIRHAQATRALEAPHRQGARPASTAALGTPGDEVTVMATVSVVGHGQTVTWAHTAGIWAIERSSQVPSHEP